MTKKEALTRFRELLSDFPWLVKLLYRLCRDPRVPAIDKAILGGVILYVLNPMDLLPDAIPVIGQIDDAYLLAVALMRLLGRTEERVLREHWEGKQDIVELIREIMELGFFYLPRRLRLILLGRLDAFPQGSSPGSAPAPAEDAS